MLRRRRRPGGAALDDNTDGLMDTLTNVVGVMALITSLTGIFATGSAINIQAPMQQKSDRPFLLLQAAKPGVWNLQPAVDQMVALDRERIAGLKRCDQAPPAERPGCEAALQGWSRQQQVGPVGVRVNQAYGLIQRNGPPPFQPRNSSALMAGWIRPCAPSPKTPGRVCGARKRWL